MGNGSRFRLHSLWFVGAMGLALTPISAPTAVAKPDNKPGAFEPGQVWDVHITISAEEFAAMQPRTGRGFPGFGPGAAPKAPEKPVDPNREVHRNNFGADLPWATGTVTIGNETFKDIGIRYKGNGTIGDASRTIKKSFKIDLDHFGGTGRFSGSKTINLHCGVADPSKLRESLGYSLYRTAGVPAPRTAFAEVRLTVPGKYDKELLGFYTATEAVDKQFLRNNFGTDAGLLLKPEGVRDFAEMGEDWNQYKKQFAPKRDATPDEAKRVVAFAQLVRKADDATFSKEIDSYLDTDAYLRFLAATAFVANSDGFFTLGHNYYIYLHPKSGRLHFFPWDLDRAFANFMILGTADQQMNLSMAHPYAGTHRLTERVLAVPGMAEKYQKLLKELSAKCFDKERLLKELEATETATKELIARDAKAAQVRKDGAPNGFGFGKPPALKTFIEKRTTSVAAQVAGTSKGHVPTNGGFGGPPPKIGDIMAGPLMGALDTNEDGQLSRDEWIGIAKKVFDASEKDKDGLVDQKALTVGLNGMFPKPPEGSPPPPGGFSLGNFMAGPILSRADANKDGKLTSEELIGAASKLFDAFDKKKAGKLEESAFSEMLSDLFPAPKFGPPPGPPTKDGKKP
ncbi:spore coat assembly protein : Spore coat assembly protein OS=uncultured Oceanospirillales bacterium HF0500_29K23 PE=4 SV=1: CotH: EF-hand_5: EF-hand_5 [Gemmata massiliana]|uniref:EF-hand domain-containing protein n=1 Tax=Gemmata massiliana TaxID=1210884 RepID=A0A6P2CYM3_9BACT|nr:CotH kinase family protein [Gemmata massiliana]VTR93657.1 spore coat assembly protein : Spore coat assembly protein OS=uncultured Oceanospirillales bacterium HF0500_29K23 PE=4 SV=1: CotH: EF-hand_5: EF-hand_5 [Gemmata massiliana]